MTCHRRILDGRRDLLAPAAACPGRYPCLLESVVHGTAQSRHDILFAFPRERMSLHADGGLRDDAGVVREGRFLDALDAAWQAERLPPESDGLPFHGGWVLLLAYELAGEIEPTLKLRPPSTLPLALAVRCPAAVIVDHVRNCTILVAEAGCEHLLDALEADLAAVPSMPPLPALRDWDEDAPQQFLDGVVRIHEHLHAGDIFQVNLSRAWRAHFAQPPVPASLYAVLRRANPAPFAGLLQQPGWAVASSSPERLVEVRGGVAQTRPIAGTRPRLPGDDDAARIRELSAHPKERAEHVMLIDLERNDLGRVCVPGTVEVDELMAVESYAHVHHIVSNVRGRLRAGVTPGEVIAATFPGGTITGCPKVRCMEIIAALEDAPRGAYTGALGYLDRNGELDLNILIRTLTLAGDEVSLRAGAGIVADSVAASELDETRAKARGLLRALGVPDS
ncbi:aminodeoxychorismate synthase component I [Rhodanobacter denitrificans]|uniref:Anthranilate/para-aminobenzoate synthase component I n=1 Tax=Rhodanobacter denitrificans TaxID=666685 RepID=M4NF27_9GAMM|nr:aminodeoxychorismate synthase component I [Rhodanobacter denitrificans]AGG88597.1 anthranilate/para-aminobenzoate synthase component I [Rhodanobacter denitrificans]UJJ58736.1 aminodeoxychorismate synthase component I [Rhodanobacter denitrificans]UJM87732.1 aminodeoxychorismate synthase component I [Rhodanobacter denitrificans]